METLILRALVLLLTVAELLVAQSQEDDVTVTLEQGAVKGLRIESVRDEQLVAFLGIPYAKPPVGKLRFKVRKELISIAPLNDVLSTSNSVQLQVRCGPRVGVKEQEDCWHAQFRHWYYKTWWNHRHGKPGGTYLHVPIFMVKLPFWSNTLIRNSGNI